MATASLMRRVPAGAALKRRSTPKDRKHVAHSKKADLIRTTYTLMSDTSPQDLSIRAIAAAAGCTTGAVYRHFESADHLILVAAVKFLEDYIVDLNDLLKITDDPLTQHMEMWRSFGRQAFANVDAFEMMFWKASEEALNDAIFTYYQEFPESWRKLSGFQVMVFFSSSLEERNMLTLNRCMEEFKLSKTTIKMINDVEICSFHGLMMEYRETYREPGKAEEGLIRYMSMLDYILGTVRTVAQQ
ncbi:MAG TPA: hypothetical protein DCP91_05200 [Eggerthellaceae bacterium]|nr:hypothetical protein [Eggerthellaceae bacterium]